MKIISRFRHAVRGLGNSLARDHSVILHFVTAFVILILGVITCISSFEWIVILLIIGMVIGTELINSALEGFMDHIHPEKHDRVKEAKDTAAAAVLVVSVIAALVGLIIFIPPIISGNSVACLMNY